MTITASVKRHSSNSGSLDEMGDFEFVTMPREGEVVSVDGADEGEVQRVEHQIAPGKPPKVVIFIYD